MGYEAVVIGDYGKESLAIIHADNCGESIRECAAIMVVDRKRAIVMRLEAGNETVAKVEIMGLTGIREEERIAVARCCRGKICGEGKSRETRVRVNEIGAVIAERDQGKWIKCDVCGKMNETIRITCGQCRRNLWKANLTGRLFELNRRLRDAMARRDIEGIKRWRGEIAVRIRIRNNEEWSINDQGLAVRKVAADKGLWVPGTCPCCGKIVEDGKIYGKGCVGGVVKMFGTAKRGGEDVPGIMGEIYKVWLKGGKSVIDAGEVVRKKYEKNVSGWV